ncbi:MAG: hypothetical protein HY542_06670, partial [Deltaproteobacteria bacterium]|nr:hypothetical protein [Deltaproteobacteria bacterium]
MSTPLKTTHLLIITPLAFFAVTLLTDPQIARAETAYSSRCMTTPGFEYNDGDTDKDGLKDWEEDRNHNCRLDPGETVPYLPFDGYLSYYPDRPVPADATDEVKLAMAKDTDGDGIDDLHEYFRNETAHRDYVTAVGVFAAEEQRITRNDTERTPLLTPEQKNAIFRCPEATNPFDCDGDGRGNANDREADGDGIPDRLENCNLDPEGYVAGARYWDPDRGEGGALVQGIPDSNSSTEAGSLCTADERLVDFFVGVSYLWQETDPYSSDTDGDGIPEGRVEPGKDLCPNAEGGEILSGADGTRKGFGEEAAAADFTCVKALCKPALFSKLPGTWDTDVDGRTDKIEDVDGSCAVYRGEASTESDPYKYNTDGGDKNNDLLRDGEDPCPLNSDTRCAYVCKPGGFGDPADPTKGMHVGHMTTVNRGEKDYDGDTLYDITEDVDGDCEYTGPSDLKGAKGRAGVSKETNWRDADTDHDAYEYDAGGNPVGDPLFDITLGPQQARGTDQYDRCPHLNPDDDETNGWPHCLRHYCSSASDERGLGRLNYTITESGNADGDGLSDAQEDKNGNCRYDAARVEFGETVSRETNWLEPDSDFDGIPDLRDACGSQPEIWRADDYDGDGLTNGEEDADHDCFVDP